MPVEASPLHEGILTFTHTPAGVLVALVHSPKYYLLILKRRGRHLHRRTA